MSKVISFSISDKYLEKLRALYPSLTDNLAAKQFVTDGLDSSLSNSLDDALDDSLDDKLKSLIESELDGILDERLNAVVGKLITSLSERMARLEERLDDGLDGRLDESIARLGSCFSHRLLGLEKRLDEMELLLRMQREASIATSPLPPDEPDQPGTDAIASIDGTVESVEPISTIELDKGAIEDSEKKIIPLPDTLIVSPIETVESGSESISSINEPDTDAIGPVPGDSSPIEPGKGEGMNPNQAHKYLISKGIEDISYYYLNKWAKAGVIDTSPQGKNAIKHLILRGELYFPKTDQP